MQWRSDTLISLIVPVFNSDPYLDRCICSILNQTHIDFELLLIDDGSTDSSYSICKKYEQMDKRIRLYQQTNQGVSYCRNLGMRLAKGDFLQFVDADDELSNDCLENLYYAMMQDNSKIAVCSYADFYEDGSPSRVLDLPVEGPVKMRDFVLDFASAQDFSMIFGGCWNKLFDLDFLRQSHVQFDESLCLHEDSVFLFQVFRHVDAVFVINKPLYRYFHHTAPVSLTHRYHESMLEMTQTFYLEQLLLFDFFQLYRPCLYENFYRSCYHANLSSILSFLGHHGNSNAQKREKLARLLDDTVFLESLSYLENLPFLYRLINRLIVQKKRRLLLFVFTLILHLKR